MISIKNTELYSEVRKELNYSFGDIFIFDEFLVSEIKNGVNFSWDKHGKHIVEDVSCFLGTDGRDIVYISNRIYPYSVVALDWLKFFRNQYFLKDYYIVSDRKQSMMSLMVEELFFKDKINNFDCLYTAVNWAKSVRAIVA